MKITLSLDDELVMEVRKIAVERGTTLTGLVRAHLEELARGARPSRPMPSARDVLERTFNRFQCRLSKKTWRREDLYDRS